MDDKDLLVVFGLNLKYERLKHKYSQEKVAGELNFSTSYGLIKCRKCFLELRTEFRSIRVGD